jgi:carboxyl-terminal processing protease
MSRRLKVFVVSLSTVLVAFLLLGAVMKGSASPDDAYPQLGVYAEVLSRIKSEYVEEPDIKSVTLGAVNGMLEAIDPFASYLNPEQYKQYVKSLDAKKATVGLVLSKKFGYVGVVDAIPGSSAAKAGLSTGDMIETINGVATRDMPLAYAELLLSGDPNTSVELSVLRIRKPDPQKLNLTRSFVKYPPVTGKELPEQVGLIQAPSLDAAKVKEIAGQVESLEKQGATKLVLDLRSCSNGKPEDGAALANLFLDKGLLTYVLGQKVERKDISAEPGKAITKLPLVVLTNRGTAGGAEVAAAALQDNHRAEVIGERTYGDAAIRRAVQLDDGSAVILSVAKYYSPAGKALQDTGVTPGIMVADAEVGGDGEEDDSSAVEQTPDTTKKGEDAVLKRAIDYLTKGKTQTASTPNTQDRKDGDRTPGGAMDILTPEKPIPQRP